MDSITKEAHYRRRMLKYEEKHGATKTAIRYRTSRKTIYKWKNRYDGTLESLKDQSRRPHHSPNGQTKEEIAMVKNAYCRDKGGDKLVMWHQCRKRGYTRTYWTFLRTIRRLFGKDTKKRHKKKPKPYKKAEFPGQKMQADVKYVPSECIAGEGKYYQYTMVDEYSRLTFRQMYAEHSTHSSYLFLLEAVKFYKKHGIEIKQIQTDNGTEWTKELISNDPDETMWETLARELGINLTRIRIATPQHNGKVERQHRKDEQRFYRKMRMFSLEDGRKQLSAYQKRAAEYPIISLGFRSPLEMIAEYKRMSNYGTLALAC